MCSDPYQDLGLLLVFVIVELVPSQNKPAAVPRLNKAPLLFEPPTPDDAGPSLPLGLRAGVTSTALRTALGHALVVHRRDANLQRDKRKGQKEFKSVWVCRGSTAAEGE